MYNTYYGFREKPFKLVPNPDFLYLSKSHQIALAHLTYAVDQGDGFAVITGEVGTGKTTLCRIFLERLGEGTESAYIFNPKLDSVQLLNAICNEFGIRTNHNNVKQLLDVINGYLIMQNQANRKVVLLIDEAQNLSVENLEMVRMLSNLETTRNKLLQIILVGQPELSDTLDGYELRQLAQRISLNAHLTPLSLRETTGYIQHRVNIAAQKQVSLFTRGACKAIYHHTNGIPRIINIVCDRALLTAYSLDSRRVTTAAAKLAIQEISSRGRTQSGWRHGRKAAWACVLLALLIASGTFVFKTELFGSHARAPDGVPRHKSLAIYPIVPPESVGAAPATKIDKHPRPGTPDPGSGIAAIIDTLTHQESRLMAVTRVLDSWKQTAPHPAQLPTMVGDQEYFDIAAHQYGLRSYRVQEDWDLIKQINLPTIVALKQPSGQQVVYMALVGWEGSEMQLSSGFNRPILHVDQSVLMPYLHGLAFVYWKNLIGFDGIVSGDAPERSISLVKNMLRRVGYEQIGAAPVFDAETRQAIVDFQMRHNLVPDGLVGPLTKIVLTREADAADLPRLRGSAAMGGA